MTPVAALAEDADSASVLEDLGGGERNEMKGGQPGETLEWGAWVPGAHILMKGLVASTMSCWALSHSSSTCLKHMGHVLLRWYHCMMHLFREKGGGRGREGVVRKREKKKKRERETHI